MTTSNSLLENRVIASELIVALLWEGEKPIPFHFDRPLREGLIKAIEELHQEQHPIIKEPVSAYLILQTYQHPELGKLLEQIIYGERTINPWEHFNSTRCWWQGGPLKPISESSVKESKVELRKHFGDSYEAVVQRFVPHFQRLARDYT